VFVLAAATSARAQSYELTWWTVDGGGAAATGGSFALAGTAGQPDAGGPFTGASYRLHSGFWATAAGGTVVPAADLAVAKADGPDPVAAGGLLTYTITATNLGPAPSPSTTVTDPLPAGVSFVSASAGCTQAAGLVTCALGQLAAGTSATVTIVVAVGPGATGVLTNTAAVSGGAADPFASNNTDTETTLVVLRAEGELAHGSVLRADLAAVAGTADVDPDGSTVLQGATAVGSGPARSLRFVNATSGVVDGELVRVRSASCGSDCGPDDTYRVRAWETTGSVPRFNNSGSQVTVLLLQNAGRAPIAGTVYAWDAGGALAGQQPFTLAPHALLVLNTGGLAPGAGGSLTVAHDGPYGVLAGKTVALEPATGFSFDSPLVPRPR
jgi:uncharacterized repeat protein (TIGR01451 family)